MIDQVLYISKGISDLPRTSEMWVKCTFEQKKQAISDYIIGCRGYAPSPNMIFIRKVEFDIPDTSTIYDLKRQLERIKNECGIECFQICIDRAERKCYMLFDWYDYEKQVNGNLYEAHQYRLSVIIMKAIGRPIHSSSPLWLRYFMQDAYKNDPKVFDNLLDWVKHQQPGKENYSMLRISLEYAKQVCQGLEK